MSAPPPLRLVLDEAELAAVTCLLVGLPVPAEMAEAAAVGRVRLQARDLLARASEVAAHPAALDQSVVALVGTCLRA
ncbi:MAG: hypothetical protein JO157_18515, partial [Acetobacteraceae bacterium]|nr:hypothetical protein [Acetobacteraceae bacterium]